MCFRGIGCGGTAWLGKPRGREEGREGGKDGVRRVRKTVETYSCRVVKGIGKRAKLGPEALLRLLLLLVR